MRERLEKRVKVGFELCWMITVLSVLFLAAAEGNDEQFPSKALFDQMVGEWTGEGSLTSMSGDVTEVSEVWVGKFVDEGKGFVVEGDRNWNGEAQTFKWVYSYNATTELIDVVYSASNFDKELLMEVSVYEAEGVITRRAPMGDEGAEIQIENKFVKGVLVSRVTLTGGNGQTTLEGVLKHRRKKVKE